MAYTPKPWQDSPSTATPISAAALVDLEARLAAYTDTQVAGVAGLSASATLDHIAATNPTAGNVSLNGFRLTSLGDAAVNTDAVNMRSAEARYNQQQPPLQFGRVQYGNNNLSLTDIQQRGYSVIVLQTNIPDNVSDIHNTAALDVVQIASIRAAMPTTKQPKFLMYRIAVELASQAFGQTTFTRPASNQSGWYLRGADGTPYGPLSGLAGGNPQMDFGNVAYQQAAISRAITMCVAAGYDGVLIDNVIANPISGGSYTTNLPGNNGTLSGTLSTSPALTTLNVNALASPLASGQQFFLDDGNGHIQYWVTTGAAAAGATTVPVVSQAPTFPFPANATSLRTTLSSDATYNVAWDSFLANMKLQFSVAGLTVVSGNCGGSLTQANTLPILQAHLDAGMDMMMDESFSSAFQGNSATAFFPVTLIGSPTIASNAVQMIEYAESHGKTMLLHSYIQGLTSGPNNGLIFNMAVCTALLAANGHTCFIVDNASDATGVAPLGYNNEFSPTNSTTNPRNSGPWWPIYDKARALGAPLAPYITSNSVWRRDFANGFVLVNNNNGPQYEPLSGITMPAHGAQIFERARTNKLYTSSVTDLLFPGIYLLKGRGAGGGGGGGGTANSAVAQPGGAGGSSGVHADEIVTLTQPTVISVVVGAGGGPGSAGLAGGNLGGSGGAGSNTTIGTVSTTVAAGSNGVNTHTLVGAQTVSVGSTTNFLTSGIAEIVIPKVSTTIAAGSNGVGTASLTGSGVINVAPSGTTGMPSVGVLSVTDANGTAYVSYTGTSGGNQFTGCTFLTGASGNMTTGGAVVYGGNCVFEYTGTSGGNSLTGCTYFSGPVVQMTTGATVSAGDNFSFVVVGGRGGGGSGAGTVGAGATAGAVPWGGGNAVATTATTLGAGSGGISASNGGNPLGYTGGGGGGASISSTTNGGNGGAAGTGPGTAGGGLAGSGTTGTASGSAGANAAANTGAGGGGGGGGTANTGAGAAGGTGGSGQVEIVQIGVSP